MTKKIFKGMALLLCLTLIVPFTGNIKAFASEIQAPQIIGESSITMDMDTGEVIYSKNADVKRSPASTTKLLTSLIFAENKIKSDIIPYSEYSASLNETTLNSDFMGMTVKVGDTMSADDVMKAVMIYSANDTSVLMAESVAGSVDAFSKMMNDKAKELGAINSIFLSPNGLEDPNNSNNNNQTTAHDLALIAIAAYKNDWIRETMSLDKTSLDLAGHKIFIETRNKNLNKDGNTGGKTGTESLAGHCFVGYYNRDGRNLVTVVLGSEYGADGTNVFNDTNLVADYSYSATKEPYKTNGEEIGNVDLSYKLFRFFGPIKTISAPVILSQDVEYYKNDYNDANANLSLSNTEIDAWKVASNNSVDLTLSIGSFTENVKGTIGLTTVQILKANLPIYAAAILGTIIAVVLIVIIVNLIRKSGRKNKRNRYYR